jgi:hypothetical protein
MSDAVCGDRKIAAGTMVTRTDSAIAASRALLRVIREGVEAEGDEELLTGTR